MTDKTFRPTTEDGQVKAGGVSLFELDLQRGVIIFEDRWKRRCQQRGTTSVPISLYDLLDEIRYQVALSQQTE